MYDLAGTPPVLSFNPSIGIHAAGGKTFYVRESTGSNDNEGTDPQYPLADLEAAYLKCTNSKNDYIFAEYFSTLTAPPLTIGVRTIHLIALSGGNFDSRNDLNGGSGVSINIQSAGRDFELAGFNLGNDGTANALEITAGQAMYRCHIHHCTFGSAFICNDGIEVAGSASHNTIDHCLFDNQIENYAITGVDINSNIIAHNIFLMVTDATKGIYFTSGCTCNKIIGNLFGCRASNDEPDGWAIDLPVGSISNLIAGNMASECGDASGEDAYRDRSSAALATKTNMWMGNMIGNDWGDPLAGA